MKYLLFIVQVLALGVLLFSSCEESLFDDSRNSNQQNVERDGNRFAQAGPILFISYHIRGREHTAGRLLAMNEDGTSPKEILNDSALNIWDASYSPDGNKIAFVVNNPDTSIEQDSTSGLYIMNADGTERKRLLGGVKHPVWSPDSKHIIYNIRVGPEALDIRENLILNMDGTYKQFTQQFRGLFDINDWSRDGRELLGNNAVPAYDSSGYLLPYIQLVYVDLNGNLLGSWGKIGSAFGFAVYSTKGNKIAFSGHNSTNNGRAIYMMDTHGTYDTLLAITDRPGRVFDPVCFSPDNNKLLCNAGSGGDRYGSILMLNLLTGEAKEITPFQNEGRYANYSYAVNWRKEVKTKRTH